MTISIQPWHQQLGCEGRVKLSCLHRPLHLNGKTATDWQLLFLFHVAGMATTIMQNSANISSKTEATTHSGPGVRNEDQEWS